LSNIPAPFQFVNFIFPIVYTMPYRLNQPYNKHYINKQQTSPTKNTSIRWYSPFNKFTNIHPKNA